MKKRHTISAILIAIVILGALLTSNNRIRSPSLAKTTVTAMAKENGFDERETKQSKEKKSNKKTSWTTALLWLIFIAGAIDVIFLRKDSTLGNKIGEKANRFSQVTDDNEVNNVTQSVNNTRSVNTTNNVNTDSERGGGTGAEF